MTSNGWDRRTGSTGRPEPDRPAACPLAAVLWDMDGLLVDSEPLWTIAERELVAEWGQELTPAMKAAMIGTRIDVAVPTMIALAGVSADPQRVQHRLLSRMVELFTDRPPLQPGAAELLADLAAAGVAQALVSSSFRVLVAAVLASLPGDVFAVSVAGDEVSQGKPHPEPYLLAAQQLSVPAQGCIVLEDSAAGARSGATAGCCVVVVPSVVPVPTEPGWHYAASLRDLTVDGLTALVADRR